MVIYWSPPNQGPARRWPCYAGRLEFAALGGGDEQVRQMSRRDFRFLSAMCQLVLVPLLALGCSGDGKDPAATMTPDPEPMDACTGQPPFTLGKEAVGKEQAVKAVLIAASPAPPARKTNDWVVEFRDMNDAALTDVDLKSVEPFMPEHGHDGTFAPTVEAGAEPGQFDVADINLWMPGVWEVRFSVESPSAGSDYIVFEACIPE